MHLVIRNEDRIIKAPIDHVVVKVEDNQYAVCVKGRSLVINKPSLVYQAIADIAGNYHWQPVKPDTLLKAIIREELTDTSDKHM